MINPNWFEDAEDESFKQKPPSRTCKTCVSFGKFIKHVRCHDKKLRELHECAIHEGCFNTELAYPCNDYIKLI